MSSLPDSNIPDHQNASAIDDEPASPTEGSPRHIRTKSEAERRASLSQKYGHTDEWDASKVPPSQFQKRKGSIYSTPGSRDGHVDKNKDANKTHQTLLEKMGIKKN